MFVVKQDMTVDLRPIVVERQVAEATVVENGLKPDEIVVTDGQLRLVSGREGEYQIRTRGNRVEGAAMNLSALFIKRPVTTTLIMLGIMVFGVMAYRLLPVSDLPVIDFPTIQVQAGLPGASPETMATAVALPLEKQFSAIAGLTSINSVSSQGQTQHHAAVRSESQHRRGRAGRPGDDRADDARPAGEHAGAAVAAEEQPDRSVGDVPRAAVEDASALDG